MEANSLLDWILGSLAALIALGGFLMLISGIAQMKEK
jgi:hypothetical protein